MRDAIMHYAIGVRTETKRRDGFTLIEMMIIVAIVIIIMAISIPGYLRSRARANEAAAVEYLHTISWAEFAYHSSNKAFGDFDVLTAEPAPYLESSWTDGVLKGGYRYFIELPNEADFICYAEPDVPGVTGTLYYRLDSSGVIRWNGEDRPGEDDEVLE